MHDEVNVAFVSTGRAWQERWRAHLRDHGPAHAAMVIAEARTAFDQTWRIVVIDASSTLMDAAFVDAVHDRGRGVLAVWDPDEPGSKQRAVDAAADELIEADTDVLGFAATVMEMADRFSEYSGAGQRQRRPPVVASAVTRAGQLVVVGGPIGANPTQVALGLARALGRRRESVALVDTDEVTPSVAQLLDLQPVPNLASAVATVRAGGNLEDDLLTGDGYWVLGGLAEPSQWAEVGTRATLAVVLNLAARFERTVATVAPMIESSPRFATSRALLGEADTIVAVGDASPVGLTRLTLWVDELRLIAPTTRLYLVAGGAPGDRFRKGQVLDRLSELGRPESVALIPSDDTRLERAEWQGQPMRRGPLVRSVACLADTVCPTTSRKKRR